MTIRSQALTFAAVGVLGEAYVMRENILHSYPVKWADYPTCVYGCSDSERRRAAEYLAPERLDMSARINSPVPIGRVV